MTSFKFTYNICITYAICLSSAAGGWQVLATSLVQQAVALRCADRDVLWSPRMGLTPQVSAVLSDVEAVLHTSNFCEILRGVQR